RACRCLSLLVLVSCRTSGSSMLPVCSLSSPDLRLCFFFYVSGDPRDLHSFPTRRSSDLSPPWRRPPSARRWRPPRCRAATTRCTDRKSTRLNSSHQIISYAVFCLKKKNNTTKNWITLIHTHTTHSRNQPAQTSQPPHAAG